MTNAKQMPHAGGARFEVFWLVLAGVPYELAIAASCSERRALIARIQAEIAHA